MTVFRAFYYLLWIICICCLNWFGRGSGCGIIPFPLFLTKIKWFVPRTIKISIGFVKRIMYEVRGTTVRGCRAIFAYSSFKQISVYHQLYAEILRCVLMRIVYSGHIWLLITKFPWLQSFFLLHFCDSQMCDTIYLLLSSIACSTHS